MSLTTPPQPMTDAMLDQVTHIQLFFMNTKIHGMMMMMIISLYLTEQTFSQEYNE
jgi:hypothetical protein